MHKEKDPIIRIQHVSKNFKGSVVLNDICLDIYPSEFLTLVGPSGCGKTTLLRLLGGFETPSSGRILIYNQDMADIPPRERPIHTVFQSYAVFPHMTVEQNVAYGLELEGHPKSFIAEQMREMLQLVKLEKYAKSLPKDLSGGQKQRVALARALIKKPRVLLLDEPLSALDAKMRDAMRLELARLQKLVGITFIMVTHDQEEALSMSNRVAVMQEGKVLQVSDPAHLYEFPLSLPVAQFIGQINCLPLGSFKVREDLKSHKSILAVRPEKVFTAEEEPDVEDSVVVKGKVVDVMYCGKYSKIFFDIGLGEPLIVDVANVLRDIDYYTFRIGEELWCHWRLKDCLYF